MRYLVDRLKLYVALSIVGAAVIAVPAAVAWSASPARAAEPLPLPACASVNEGSGFPASVAVRANAMPVPAVTARTAVVIDGETGRVLLDLGAHERRAPASTTKIMTAILALELVPQESWVVSETDSRSLVGSSVMGLRRGQYIQMRDLLFGLMLPSGNDAAIEIAKNTWGTEPAFVEAMNERARQLGLANTHFVNPHGLDAPGHYSSAYDLAMLGRYAMANPAFREIANARVHHLSPPADYNIYNGNSMPEVYSGAEGVKIGWTGRARWTLVTSATRNGHTLYVAVLGSEDRDGDAAALFDWGFASHDWRPLAPRLTTILRVAQGLGVGESLTRLVATCA